MKKKKIMLFSITGILMLCVICVISTELLDNRITKQSYHVYCELLTPGISLSEAKERLSRVGPYTISDGPEIYYISFQDFLTYISVGKLRLFFDEDKRLVSVLRKISVSDWSSEYWEDCHGDR